MPVDISSQKYQEKLTKLRRHLQKKILLWNAHGTPISGWNGIPGCEKKLFMSGYSWHIAPRTPRAGVARRQKPTKRNGTENDGKKGTGE
jgi:hypothetical protein